MATVLTMDEFNEKLAWLKTCNARVAKEGEGRGSYKYHKTCDLYEAFISESDIKIKLVMKEPGDTKAKNYIFFLDGAKHYEDVSVAAAAKEFYSYYKPPDITEPVGSASPILGFNPKYEGTRNYAYEYDLNSAYSSALLGYIPDTTKFCGSKIVEEDELGYDSYIRLEDSFTVLYRVEVGQMARYVFKKMKSPYVGYITKYYNIKKNSKGEEREKAKAYLNIAIGNLQNRNPFVRAEVVGMANKRVEDLIDENTLYWNTDSIVSLVRRPDIEKDLGTEIGQWKLDKEGEFAYKGQNYQWNREVPGMRRIPKAWFVGVDFDILRDTAPVRNNPYIFDWEEGKIKRNEGFKVVSIKDPQGKTK